MNTEKEREGREGQERRFYFNIIGREVNFFITRGREGVPEVNESNRSKTKKQMMEMRVM
jgi:hypothetical protein